MSINNIDINKIVVSKKFPLGKQVLNIHWLEWFCTLVHNINLYLNIEGPPYICAPLVLIDSVYIIGKKHYPQVFLMEEHYNNIDINIVNLFKKKIRKI